MRRAAADLWTGSNHSTEELQEVARRMIVARRALHGPLPSAILHDAPLEILLRVFVAGDDHMSLQDLQSAMLAPATVVGRWLAALTHDGLTASIDSSIRLTGKGRDTMLRALDAVIQSQAALSDPSSTQDC